MRYHIIWLSFEGISEESFETNGNFIEIFISMVAANLMFTSIDLSRINAWQNMKDWNAGNQKIPFEYLSRKITDLCKNSDKEVLLMIDEVDKISDNQVFLNFLGMLRNKYLFRNAGRDFTFKSVICLASMILKI